MNKSNILMLEKRISRLERMIRNSRKAKNEAAGVGRKMYALDTGKDLRTGMYVISDDKRMIDVLPEAVDDFMFRNGYNLRTSIEIVCGTNAIVIEKPCRFYNRPTVTTYGDYLDSQSSYDSNELSHLGYDNLVFVDENEQVHELAVSKIRFHE